MDLKHVYYPESRFGGFTDIDGTIKFYMRVNALLKPDCTFLDVGCGRGRYARDNIAFRRNLRIFKGRCQKVIGLDVDDAGRGNPFLDEFHLVEPNKAWPIADDSVDICLSDWTLEHVERPSFFFSEAARVLRSGGFLCLRTSNLLHYRSVVATLLPGRYHPAFLRRVQQSRQTEDIFPTLYRCNTVGKVKSLLGKAGFRDSVTYVIEAEPAYLAFSRIFYVLGVIYQRLAPQLFRAAIVAFAQK